MDALAREYADQAHAHPDTSTRRSLRVTHQHRESDGVVPPRAAGQSPTPDQWCLPHDTHAAGGWAHRYTSENSWPCLPILPGRLQQVTQGPSSNVKSSQAHATRSRWGRWNQRSLDPDPRNRHRASPIALDEGVPQVWDDRPPPRLSVRVARGTTRLDERSRCPRDRTTDQHRLTAADQRRCSFLRIMHGVL